MEGRNEKSQGRKKGEKETSQGRKETKEGRKSRMEGRKEGSEGKAEKTNRVRKVVRKEGMNEGRKQDKIRKAIKIIPNKSR